MFKIIHIADAHYAARPKSANLLDFVSYKLAGGVAGASLHSCLMNGFAQRSHCPDIALGAARFLSQNLLDHHIMVVGGDVGSTGLEEDQSAAYNYLKGTPLRRLPYRMEGWLPTLAIRSRMAIMPGNHDRFQDNKCRSNGIIFNKYFDREWGDDKTKVKIFTAVDRQSGKRLRMIAADFCLQDDNQAFPAGYPFCCGQGTVDPTILQELCDKTATARAESKDDGIIWLSHFPPYGDMVGLLPGLQLNGYPDLIAAANKSEIKFILSGHIHENRDSVESGVRVLTVGSVCSFMEPVGNWIRSVTFDVKNGLVDVIDIRDYTWNRRRKIFH